MCCWVICGSGMRQKVDAAASVGVSADMSVGVRTSSAAQAESAEQSGGSASMTRADASVHPDWFAH